jgi:amidohydrolase
MSMLLSFARFLKNNENALNDNILLIFQPAEEGPGGAELIVKAGILKRFNVSQIYGIHLNPLVSQGKIGLCSGPMMAMAGEFDIVIRSKSSHGAIPHEGIDSITIAAEIISGLQTIVSRNINPIKSAVLTIGKIEAGERRNIIAGRAKLEGTMRAFEKEVYYTMKKRMQDYLKGIEIAYGVIIDLDVRDMYPPVVNHADLFDQFIHRMSNALGDMICEIIDPQMISEDFSYYQEVVPGLFYFVGTRNEGKGYTHSLHHCEFNFDPIVLVLGLRTYIEVLIDNDSINAFEMLK